MKPIFIIEIGSSKITLARVSRNKQHCQDLACEILSVKASGISSGKIVEIKAAQQAIQQLIDRAESDYDWRIRSVYLGISGSGVTGFTDRYKVIGENTETLNINDISRIKKEYITNFSTKEKELLHLFPVGYRVDDRDWLSNPLGFRGAVLEAKLFCVVAKTSYVRDAIDSINRCGIKVADIFCSTTASTCAFSDAHLELSEFVYVELGQDKTDAMLFEDRGIKSKATLELGGRQITSDLAHCFGSTHAEAELLKLNFRTASSKHSCEDKVKLVIKERANEILRLVLEKLGSQSRTNQGLPIVLAGGSAQGEVLAGLSSMNPQIVIPRPEFKLSPSSQSFGPEFAAILGLASFALRSQEEAKSLHNRSLASFFWRANHYLKGLF